MEEGLQPGNVCRAVGLSLRQDLLHIRSLRDEPLLTLQQQAKQ